MPDPSAERLIAALGRSSFTRVALRSGALTFEFSRQGIGGCASAESGAAGPAYAPADKIDVSAHPLPSPATGVVSLTVLPGSMVEAGEVVGAIQMHRRDVPVIATVAGWVVEVQVTDGGFVEYGEQLLTIAGRRP